MILRQLNLIGFGRFENKTLNLKKGINLIYGENEMGKSTIHSFIDGMFYGFLKPNVRSALYTEEYNKYDPWNSNRYGGILIFENDEKHYRIERDFRKGKESTKVLEEGMGTEITKLIDTGNSRVLQPGVHFFGFNTSVFSNTISIKQLETKTDDKLAKEVTEKLINVTSTLDEEISVDKAVLNLKSIIDEIGTERAPTKPYAKNINKITSLINEKEKILSKKHEYESFLDEKLYLLNELSKEEDKYTKLKEELIKAKIIEKKIILKESKDISEEIKQLNLNIIELPSYGDSIQEDYNIYEEIEEEKNHILYNNQDNKLEFLKRDYKSYKEKRLKKYILTFLSIISNIILLLINKLKLGLIVFLIIIYLALDLRKTKDLIRKIELDISSRERAEKNKTDRIYEKEELQKRLLDKYNVINKIEFKNLLNKIQRKLDSREDFIRRIEMKKDLLKRILSNDTIEVLEKELEGNNLNIDESIDKDLILMELDISKDKIESLKINLKEVETNFNILEKDICKLSEIEEEIYRKEKYKDEMDYKLTSLNLAINTIEDLSKDIHSQFAPLINRKISNVIDEITGGKYNNMKISKTLEMTIENPLTKELIDITNLSGGTIDQLYFSLRFGIINSIGENNLPLILDDCFVQYDDSRLKNIIKFLSKVREERQIILFSCHNREQKIMDELGVDYNFINLT